MTKLNRLFTAFAIILGLLFIFYAMSQFDIDVGRKLAKWESQKAGVVQESPSVKVSDAD